MTGIHVSQTIPVLQSIQFMNYQGTLADMTGFTLQPAGSISVSLPILRYGVYVRLNTDGSLGIGYLYNGNSTSGQNLTWSVPAGAYYSIM